MMITTIDYEIPKLCTYCYNNKAEYFYLQKGIFSLRIEHLCKNCMYNLK